MPVASSSRSSKRQRRAVSSDIEEDGPSQAPQQEQQEDVEMDEEERPRRSKKSGKKEKKRAAQQDSDGEDMEEPVEEDIPIPELGDQPLDKNQAAKLRGMSSDWAMLRDKVHLPGYNFIREVASSVAEFTEGEKGEKALTQIDTLMRELLDTEYELTAHEKSLDGLYQKLARNETIEGVTDAYHRGVQEQMETYQHKTSRQKYAKSEHYQKFKQAVYEVQHPDIAMPPLADLIPPEDGDDSDDDDDVQVGGVTQDYKCPLTLTTLVDPLTSKVCGHSYSANAIKEYLGNSKTRSKECPATGCKKQISLAVLEPNRELAKRAKEAARRERAREEDSGDEEVIE
ncbi:hypothetical protein BN946_scf184909.g58 [Trametes cinnabarina]|uniref:SP-RING-type domain-containing protein n=1 Tax=Pycnoporus cinnabarinus TaxID=5643 RepID=A0A060SGV5_PYCCI|nr:hypothetical protein BN946_scf184909.g58 [Trametes cinnabarina]